MDCTETLPAKKVVFLPYFVEGEFAPPVLCLQLRDKDVVVTDQAVQGTR